VPDRVLVPGTLLLAKPGYFLWFDPPCIGVTDWFDRRKYAELGRRGALCMSLGQLYRSGRNEEYAQVVAGGRVGWMSRQCLKECPGENYDWADDPWLRRERR
jgi:hypothetical protein